MDGIRYEHILRFVAETPWAITASKLAVILDLIALKAAGGTLTADQVRERIGAAQPRQPARAGAVAVLPLLGTIVQRADLMTQISGGTSTDAYARAFQQILADPSVGSIVLDVDSPGGSVYGVQELASLIYRARGQKPIIAVANSLAASAAYWIASAADELYVTPSGEVGSIGVLTAHTDLSAQLEQQGVKVTLLAAGKYKAEANPFTPLSDEARAAIQARLGAYYYSFVSDVDRHRGAAPGRVRDGYGQGRVVGAQEALRLGMVDRIGTLQDAVRRAGGQRAADSLAAARSAPAITASHDLEARKRRLRLHQTAAGMR